MTRGISIEIISKKRIFKKGMKFRWVAVSHSGSDLAGNDEWYHSRDDLIHDLHLLFGPKFNGHQLVDV